ncbi:hypothetical protein MUS1_01310 [Marinomonas ushuaiensis DSM 15871]|uniref:Uncharacterized protein n=2 Tax=Marinomonas TaxID=28253 RepID=X7E9X0_9GAMM|nr:hypothetical protein MUS1_01310 [Marinomonas ushuaiensis DSM 15871]
MLASATSINEIHSCLVLTNFVDSKISGASNTYSKEEMALIHLGLRRYGNYLDHDVIDPKLLKLYGGNASQAELMKKLFSRQQASFIHYLSDRYSEDKIPTDYAIAIKECSIKTGSQGDTALALKKAINTMTKH